MRLILALSAIIIFTTPGATLQAKADNSAPSKKIKTNKFGPIRRQKDKLTLYIEKVSATEKGRILKAVIETIVNDDEMDSLEIKARHFSIDVTKTKFQNIFSVSFLCKKDEYNKAFLTRSSTLLGLIEGQIDKFSHSQTISALEGSSEESKIGSSNKLLAGILIGAGSCLAAIIAINYAKNMHKN